VQETDTRENVTMRITVVGGAGYVGLITALGFAELGHYVCAIDISKDKVERLQAGRSPIYEDGVDLDGVIKRNLGSKRISFTTDFSEGARHAEVMFIAVGTPQDARGQADLSQVIEVAQGLLEKIDGYKVIVIKSTVPVGTVELVCDVLNRSLREGEDYDIVSNPEFLREGQGLCDFFNPARIVVGARSDRAREVMRQLYAPFLASEAISAAPETGGLCPHPPVPYLETGITSAQMIKYASNAFLATRVSFINEIASICERVGANVAEVAKGMGHDPRIGQAYLQAGIGFGGPCLEKDLSALTRIAEANDYEPELLRAVLEKNEAQVRQVVRKLKDALGYLLYGKVIAVLGLAFKPGTNDVRTSLALRIIDLLTGEGAVVRAHDPVAIPEARELRPNVEYYDDPYEALQGVHALVILTGWQHFQELDFERIKGLMCAPYVIDGCNLLSKENLRDLGFNYVGVGVQ